MAWQSPGGLDGQQPDERSHRARKKGCLMGASTGLVICKICAIPRKKRYLTQDYLTH